MPEINHALDDVLKTILVDHDVSQQGAFEFMQEQVVTSPSDRHALRALMWRFAVSVRADTVLPPYDSSKMRGRNPRTGR